MSFNSDAEIMGISYGESYSDYNSDMDMAEMSKYMLNPTTYPSFEHEMGTYNDYANLDSILYSAQDDKEVRLDGLTCGDLPQHPDVPRFVTQGSGRRREPPTRISQTNRKNIEDYFMEGGDVYLQDVDSRNVRRDCNGNIRRENLIPIIPRPRPNPLPPPIARASREHLASTPSEVSMDANAGWKMMMDKMLTSKYTTMMLIAIIFILIIAMFILQIIHTRKVHKMVKMMMRLMYGSSGKKLNG